MAQLATTSTLHNGTPQDGTGEGLTLDELAVAVGDPTPVAMQVVFRGADEATMLERGREVASEVILRDGAAFVRSTRAIWAALPAEKRAKVLGYSPLLDAVIVRELGALRDHSARYDALAQGAGMSGAERRHLAKDAFARGVEARQQVFRTLADYLGAEHPVAVGLAVAMRAADDATVLANGLTQLADALKRLRHGKADAAPDPATVAVLDFAGLTDDVERSLRAHAEAVRSTADVAAAKPKDLAAAQRTLDLQDGRVLHAMGLVLRAFRRCRRVDPSVLVPELGDLARVFGGGSRSSDDDAPAPAPQPQPPVG